MCSEHSSSHLKDPLEAGSQKTYVGQKSLGDVLNDFFNMGAHLPGWEDGRKVKCSDFEPTEEHESKYWGEHNF